MVNNAGAGDDAVAVNVEPGTARMQDLHDLLLAKVRRRRGAYDVEL